MITGHVFIATSLDGFIARDHGDIAWLLERDDPGEDHGYDAFIENSDIILMGHGSYEKIQGVRPWPYSSPVVVLSASLAQEDLPGDVAGMVRVTDASPEETMRMLRSERHRRVHVDGGLVIQSFLRAGLVADMVITRAPALLGEGPRLCMKHGPDIARLAALIGDPARANMLSALMTGSALTAGELASEAGVTPQTASPHLVRLQ